MINCLHFFLVRRLVIVWAWASEVFRRTIPLIIRKRYLLLISRWIHLRMLFPFKIVALVIVIVADIYHIFKTLVSLSLFILGVLESADQRGFFILHLVDLIEHFLGMHLFLEDSFTVLVHVADLSAASRHFLCLL